MSTNSSIALELADGRVMSVYCHWDGYYSHVGSKLLNHYNTPSKALELLTHGNISSLYEQIGEKHSFDARTPSWTTFYGRDRGETGQAPKIHADFDAYLRNNHSQSYNYFMTRDGVWYASENETNLLKGLDSKYNLSNILAGETAE